MPLTRIVNRFPKIKWLALACAVVAAQPVSADNLIDVIRHTLGTNPTYYAAIANENVNRHSVRQAQGGYLPTVSLNLGVGREKTASPASRSASGSSRIWLRREEYGIKAKQLIFGGGRVYKDVMAREFDYASSRFQTHDVREELILHTAEVYLEVLRNRDLVTVADSNVKVHDETLSKTRSKFKAGAGRRVDVQLGISRLEKAKAQFDNFKGNLQSAVSNYTAITDLVPARVMRMPKLYKKWIPHSLSRAVCVALNRNPELHEANSDYLASDARVGLAASRFWPKLSLEFGAADNYNVDGIKGVNRDFSGMVTLEYDLYRGGSDLANYRASTEERRRSLRECQQTRRKIIDDVKTAWADLMATQQELTSLKVHVEATKSVVDDYKKQFAIGVRPLFNVLDAENDYFNARVAYINAKYNHAESYYRLLDATGRITAVTLGGVRH